jgi:hypothetical protein
MNKHEFAHELADELLAGGEWSLTAQATLRKQADRIRELENQLDKCSHHEAMAHQGGYEIGRASQIKDLTDEEIKEISIDHIYKTLGGERFGYLEFARTILKKASEK